MCQVQVPGLIKSPYLFFLRERLQGSNELYVILFLRKLLGYSNKALNISLSYPFLRNNFHFQIYSHECLDV